ncbi:MAG: hypothetical protein QM761_10670 [Pseudoxanthomonas sp.]
MAIVAANTACPVRNGATRMFFSYIGILVPSQGISFVISLARTLTTVRLPMKLVISLTDIAFPDACRLRRQRGMPHCSSQAGRNHRFSD